MFPPLSLRPLQHHDGAESGWRVHLEHPTKPLCWAGGEELCSRAWLRHTGVVSAVSFLFLLQGKIQAWFINRTSCCLWCCYDFLGYIELHFIVYVVKCSFIKENRKADMVLFQLFSCAFSPSYACVYRNGMLPMWAVWWCVATDPLLVMGSSASWVMIMVNPGDMELPWRASLTTSLNKTWTSTQMSVR